MDTITQAALGAAIAIATCPELGRRGVLFGALCGLAPDVDIVAGIGDDWRGLVHHRGYSHSLLVLPFIAPIAGWVGRRWLDARGRAPIGSHGRWTWLAFWALITHPLLDVFTSYGTQLLLPLTNERYAWDGVSIIDPVYTLPLIGVVIAALRKRRPLAHARLAARAALLWGAVYIAAGVAVTARARAITIEACATRGFVATSDRAVIPILFTPLRHVVARDASGDLMLGTVVPWAPERTELVHAPGPNDPALHAALGTEHGQILRWFSDDFLHVKPHPDDGWRIYDGRYGLFADPTWSPFQARLDGDGVLTLAKRGGGDTLDVGAELRHGWALMTGQSTNEQPAHGAEDQHPNAGQPHR